MIFVHWDYYRFESRILILVKCDFRCVRIVTSSSRILRPLCALELSIVRVVLRRNSPTRKLREISVPRFRWGDRSS